MAARLFLSTLEPHSLTGFLSLSDTNAPQKKKHIVNCLWAILFGAPTSTYRLAFVTKLALRTLHSSKQPQLVSCRTHGFSRIRPFPGGLFPFNSPFKPINQIGGFPKWFFSKAFWKGEPFNGEAPSGLLLKPDSTYPISKREELQGEAHCLKLSRSPQRASVNGTKSYQGGGELP